MEKKKSVFSTNVEKVIAVGALEGDCKIITHGVNTFCNGCRD